MTRLSLPILALSCWCIALVQLSSPHSVQASSIIMPRAELPSSSVASTTAASSTTSSAASSSAAGSSSSGSSSASSSSGASSSSTASGNSTSSSASGNQTSTSTTTSNSNLPQATYYTTQTELAPGPASAGGGTVAQSPDDSYIAAARRSTVLGISFVVTLTGTLAWYSLFAN